MFGCLGIGVPYAIAAAEVYKDLPIICVTGDGAFGFNAMELDTALEIILIFVLLFLIMLVGILRLMIKG